MREWCLEHPVLTFLIAVIAIGSFGQILIGIIAVILVIISALLITDML